MSEQFIVINSFRDKSLNKDFLKGSTYESEDSERIAFLQEAGFLKGNDQPPEEQPSKDELKHVGGGWYELPNGEKIKGKEEAIEALKAFQATG